MANPRENPRLILKLLEQTARKRFGQNFLARADIVARMVRGARISTGTKTVEVGPGLGILTEELIRVGADLTAVELDRDLAEYIRGQFPDIRLVEGDAMRQDWRVLCPDGNWKMVANLPYNVGTQLLLVVLDLPDVFDSVTVMLQREVVQRITAVPGNKSYGSLSVRCQVRGSARFLLPVPPECFHPPPKVHSAVLLIDLFDSPQTNGLPVRDFDRVVKVAFSQRRKTIANSLGSLYGKDVAIRGLEAAAIDPGLRAEQVDVDGYRRLAVALEG